ncbi:MAG: divergent polysaccharide deacetylase family protein [Treponema sp.]|nr:divergent polysaccharide deacetylase family protein [Treponema sp.]
MAAQKKSTERPERTGSRQNAGKNRRTRLSFNPKNALVVIAIILTVCAAVLAASFLYSSVILAMQSGSAHTATGTGAPEPVAVDGEELPGLEAAGAGPDSAGSPGAVASLGPAAGGNDSAAPSSPFAAIPPARNGATLLFIIDDAGLNVNNVKRYTDLPFPVTIAVLPCLIHSRECADVARAAGQEVILHQPMQASSLSIDPGPGAITPSMDVFDIAATIKANIAEIGPVRGLNNHEGSLITENLVKVGAVLDVASELGIYFLDSRTSAKTKSRQAALERGVGIYERNAPFLDNVITREEMVSEIYKALAVANRSGSAFIIGHTDKSANILPALLREMYPHLKQKGYRFAVPSQVKL